ncbi:MAG: nucleotidyltransferase family protein [Acetobacteraceae bacterium]
MRDALAEACRRFRVRRLDVFGSAATGRGFDPGRSDIDLLVAFEPMSASEYAGAYFGLLKVLEELAKRSVDLLTEAALENLYLRRRVETERRPLFRAA